MLNDLLAQNSDIDFHKINEILFADYITEWLENKKGHVENNTWKSYESLVVNHIIPYFKPMKLKVREIKPKLIMDFYEHKSKARRLDDKDGGVAKRILVRIFCQVFKKAILGQIVDSKPAISIPIPKSTCEKHAGQFLESNEAQQVINLFDGHILKPIVIIALYYGLRRSEILGLKWDVIDLIKSRLEIKRTFISYGGVFEERERTKNSSSIRALGLIPEIKDLLINLKKQQNENKKLFGDSYQDLDYVFTQADGAIIKPDYVTRNFSKILEKANFKHLRFHDLRHSCASLLKEKGMDIKDVQMWLGHADIQTTCNIYTHISNQRCKDIAKCLEGTFPLVAG